MARKDPYIEKAYEELERMSADERKELEYEAREKGLSGIIIHRCLVPEDAVRQLERKLEKK